MAEGSLYVLDFDSRQDVHGNLDHRHFHFLRENFRFHRDYIAVRGELLHIDARAKVLDTNVHVRGLDIVVQVIFVGR
jgi:hypothetical protein